ncbi:unnamed protein product [Pleuronectes platessa]|uniref:Uncharacterized protein n=1 Tax=Pleuronectes platessa TaxID=8262 RepID=A0A9N7YC04_PLEPL|nr:unnamed protein product [Pleuronectes platessa]
MPPSDGPAWLHGPLLSSHRFLSILAVKMFGSTYAKASALTAEPANPLEGGTCPEARSRPIRRWIPPKPPLPSLIHSICLRRSFLRLSLLDTGPAHRRVAVLPQSRVREEEEKKEGRR